jgi:thioredoxin-related protein
MKMLKLLPIFCFVFLSAFAQPARTADEIMKEAYARAKKEKKNVFVKFSASWCGWCHKMDDSMMDPACKKFFDDNFVIVRLIVDESKDKKDLENAGADETRIKYNGDKNQGIPFWFIVDSEGELLGDCYIREEGEPLTVKGKNSGCPANEQEVAHFITVLKKTTRLTSAQLAIISERFRKNEIKRG